MKSSTNKVVKWLELEESGDTAVKAKQDIVLCFSK